MCLDSWAVFRAGQLDTPEQQRLDGARDQRTTIPTPEMYVCDRAQGWTILLILSVVAHTEQAPIDDKGEGASMDDSLKPACPLGGYKIHPSASRASSGITLSSSQFMDPWLYVVPINSTLPYPRINLAVGSLALLCSS